MKHVLPSASWRFDSRCGIADWIGTVLAFGPRRSTVNRNLEDPGLGTAARNWPTFVFLYNVPIASSSRIVWMMKSRFCGSYRR